MLVNNIPKPFLEEFWSPNFEPVIVLPGQSSASVKKSLIAFLETEEQLLMEETEGDEKEENEDVVKVIYFDSPLEEVFGNSFLFQSVFTYLNLVYGRQRQF